MVFSVTINLNRKPCIPYLTGKNYPVLEKVEYKLAEYFEGNLASNKNLENMSPV